MLNIQITQSEGLLIQMLIQFLDPSLFLLIKWYTHHHIDLWFCQKHLLDSARLWEFPCHYFEKGM